MSKMFEFPKIQPTEKVLMVPEKDFNFLIQLMLNKTLSYGRTQGFIAGVIITNITLVAEKYFF